MIRHDIERYWREIAVLADAMPYAAICQVAETLLDCHRRGGTIFLIGNGGSAATASHFVCDLAKGVRGGQPPPFRAISLSDNMPLITAWGNDTSFDRVFAEQLAPLVRSGDVVILISASGNSPNVLLAAQTARVARAETIALTGRSGGRLAQLVDQSVRVPSDLIEQVEDAHLVIAHSVCVTLRANLEDEYPIAGSDQVWDIRQDRLVDRFVGEAGS
jgi:D-sedoheptulose 7-phosphate isomerase